MIRGAPLLALLLTGCAYRVAIRSTPDGAQIELPDGTTTATPSQAVLRWRPFGKQIITARATGYRDLSLDLRKSEVRWGRYLRDAIFRPSTMTGEPRGTIELILVPEHEGTGTWTVDEVP